MVARKAETTEYRVEKRRPMLWIVLAGVAVAGGVFAVVNYQESRMPATLGPVATAPNPDPAVKAPPPEPAEAPVAAEPPSAAAAPPAAAVPPAAPPEKDPTPAAEPDPAPEKPVPAKVPPPVAAKRAPRPVYRPPARPARPAPAAPIAVPPAPAAAAAQPAAIPVTSPGGAAIIDDDEAIYWLRVRSTPPGADVFIDGELEGKTPFQRRIFDSTRPYAVSVRKEGFESNDRMISASDPWAKVKSEFLLTLSIKLRKAPAAAPATPPDEAAPSP